VAALRSGLISFSCEVCEDAKQKGKEKETQSYIQKSLGCFESLEIAANWLGDEDDFFNCPRKFIMQSSYDFLEKYDLYKSNFATPCDYEKQSARFLIAKKIFENFVNAFIELKKG